MDWTKTQLALLLLVMSSSGCDMTIDASDDITPNQSNPVDSSADDQTTNEAPRANAGSDLVVFEGDLVVLDATGSKDPDEDALTYRWTQIIGPKVDVESTSTPSPYFVAPEVDTQTNLEMELVVSDGVLTDSDRVGIVIQDLGDNALPNRPTVDAGQDRTVETGEQVTLRGSATNTVGAVTYTWMQVEGPSVDIVSVEDEQITFVAPSNASELLFSLTIRVGTEQFSDLVRITVSDSALPDVPEDEDPPLDQNCNADADCDDRIYCNGVESCINSRCQRGERPCDLPTVCNEQDQACMTDLFGCLDDSGCDDGLFCNGSERCEDGLCLAGDSPCSESQSCDEARNQCDPA